MRGLDEDRRGGIRHLGRLPAHHAAEPDDSGVVGHDEVARVQLPVGAVEGGQPLTVARTSYDDRAAHLVGVVAVDGATGLEHDVVGDVDRQRDRPHPGGGDPLGDEVRRGRVRVEAPHRAGDEDRAAFGVLHHDRVALVVGRGRVAHGGIAEVARALDRDQHLAGDAADGQRVRAVGVDLELDGLLVESEQGAYVLAGLAGVGGEHDDPVVVLADAELARGTDHPGRDVAVGLARGDLEPAGQDSPGQHDDDQVARREVVGPADDALRLTGAVGVGDVDGAPVDGLAVLLRLGAPS